MKCNEKYYHTHSGTVCCVLTCIKSVSSIIRQSNLCHIKYNRLIGTTLNHDASWPIWILFDPSSRKDHLIYVPLLPWKQTRFTNFANNIHHSHICKKKVKFWCTQRYWSKKFCYRVHVPLCLTSFPPFVHHPANGGRKTEKPLVASLNDCDFLVLIMVPLIKSYFGFFSLFHLNRFLSTWSRTWGLRQIDTNFWFRK